jgi:hypothetical protein
LALFVLGLFVLAPLPKEKDSSSSRRGARVHKATEMSPFLLSIRELGVLHHFCFNNLLFALSGVLSE